jgi:DNA-binding response OmpR family regulator
VPKVLVASDAAWVRDQVRAALVGPNFEVIEVSRGQDVRKAVEEDDPDLVIVDMQIGNMGGMAVSLDLRLEESADRLPYVPILLLLDREADRFLGRRSEADAMLVKPVDAGTLRRTVKRLLEAEAERQRIQEEDEAETDGATDGEAEAGSG